MSVRPLDQPLAVHLGLSDVALLAKVRRPVVSTWLARAQRSGRPFPAPVWADRGRRIFDGAEVVEWLERSGRGNNPDAAEDLAAFATFAGAPADDEATVHGLTGLLCLLVSSGALPLNRGALLDLADEVDPDDEFLLAEVEALDSRLPDLARYVRLQVDAAYHPAAAFEALAASWARAQSAHPATPCLAPSARAVVADLAVAIAAAAGLIDPVFVDPTGGSDLLLEIARRSEHAEGCSAAVPVATTAARRLALRRLHVHGVARTPLHEDGDGGFVMPAGSVAVLQLPAAGGSGMTELEVLQALDDVVLGAAEHQRVLVVAAASALSDRLAVARDGPGRPRRDAERHSEASRVRDDVLRTGRVRAIVRLPAGLIPARPRQRLALWCLGPAAPDTATPGSPSDDARTLVGDLANTTLDAAATAALVADLVAAMAGPRAWRAHAARFLRPVFTRTLLALDGDLVVPAPFGRPRMPPAAALDDVRELVRAVRAPIPLPVEPPVAVRGAAAASGSTTVEGALERRELEVVPGVKVSAENLGASGGARVIGADDLADPGVPHRRIDRLVLAAQHPGAEYTEPGDVVFTTSPRPCALVDVDGGSVVAAPARALRCRHPALVPAVLAADIAAQGPQARTWRAWQVRRVPVDQVTALTTALDDLAHHRALLRERLGHLDRLSAALTDGVAAGALHLTPPD